MDINKLNTDLLFLFLPTLSVIVSWTWRDFLYEYMKQFMKEEQILKKKLYIAIVVTLIASIILYIIR